MEICVYRLLSAQKAAGLITLTKILLFTPESDVAVEVLELIIWSLKHRTDNKLQTQTRSGLSDKKMQDATV